MDDAEFLRQLTALDREFAERWKRLSGGKLKTWLGPKAIETLLFPILKTNKVTANQAKAMALLWLWGVKTMTKQAQIDFYVYVSAAYDEGWFFAGSAVPLTGDKLHTFYTALGMAYVRMINFVSPKTGQAYTPDLYNGVRGLVAKGGVTVYDVDAGALLSRGGVYYSDSNHLVVYKGLDAEITRSLIVHEATHTIQDWHNLVSTHKYIEADAYVAQAVGLMSTGKQYFLEYPAQETAGRLVLAGKGVAGNADWSNAYDAVSAPWRRTRSTRRQEPSVQAGRCREGPRRGKGAERAAGGYQAGRGARRVGCRRAKSGYREMIDGVTRTLP